MGDEYQLRVDVDRLWKSIYNLDDDSLRVVTIGDTVQKIRELKSLDKIFEYYQLLNIADEMTNKVNRSELNDKLYPIGSVIFNTDSTFNPSDYYDGTWESIECDLTGIYAWERINETE